MDSRADIITGLDDDPVKNIVGAEVASERAGQFRYTSIASSRRTVGTSDSDRKLMSTRVQVFAVSGER
jgi:hypothetical protein